MKRIGLVVIFLLFSQAALAVENTGFYFGVCGGYVIPQAVTLDDQYDTETGFDVKLKNGGMIGLTSGWINPFTNNIMAMELEYNYIFGTDLDPSKAVDGWGYFDGTINIHAFLFNIKARYPNGPVHPYAGIGLGYSFFQLGEVTGRDSEGSVIFRGQGLSGGGLTYQLLAGVDFDITRNLSLGVGYKYFVTRPSLGSEGPGYRVDVDSDYRASIVTAGLTYTF